VVICCFTPNSLGDTDQNSGGREVRESEENQHFFTVYVIYNIGLSLNYYNSQPIQLFKRHSINCSGLKDTQNVLLSQLEKSCGIKPKPKVRMKMVIYTKNALFLYRICSISPLTKPLPI